MGALTGFIAGVATMAAGIALVRYAERQVKSFYKNFGQPGARDGAERETSPVVIDFERDPVSGSYRLRDHSQSGRSH